MAHTLPTVEADPKRPTALVGTVWIAAGPRNTIEQDRVKGRFSIVHPSGRFGLSPFDMPRPLLALRLSFRTHRSALRAVLFPRGLRSHSLLLALETGLLALLIKPLMPQFGEEPQRSSGHGTPSVIRSLCVLERTRRP